jgi:hypothetical protein
MTRESRGIPHHDRLGNHPLGGYMRKFIIVCVSVLTLLAGSSIALADQGASAAATSGLGQGVTASSIRIGISVVDFSAITKAGGAPLDQGNVQDAYNALIANVNRHGGINGRKIVPFYATVNPLGTAPAATACTTLTEDDHVFAAFEPLNPECYTATHKTAVIDPALPGPAPAGSAPAFSVSPPTNAFDPLMISAMTKSGVFKGKKVGVVGTSVDNAELRSAVLPSLKKNHVAIVQTAIESAPILDTTAAAQQIGSIALKFKGAGVNLVVAVGQAGAIWPSDLQANQSTYAPEPVATSESDLSGYASSKNRKLLYLKGLVTATATPPAAVTWNDADIKSCVHIIKKASPNDAIASPIGAPLTGSTTWVAPAVACQAMALFVDVAKAAGKTLNTATFTKAGESLRNVALPGAGGPVSFGPNKPYGIGPVYLVHFDSSTGNLVTAGKSATG